MANSCRIAFLHATFFGIVIDDVLGEQLAVQLTASRTEDPFALSLFQMGMSQSFRGTKIHMVLRLDQELSEGNMPEMLDTDDNEAVFDQTGVDDEMADSDENDDIEESDEEDTESDEGEGIAETIEHLTRVGRMADTNSDGILSSQELVAFANNLRDQKKWEHTKSVLGELDTNGDGHVTHAEMQNRLSTPAKSDDQKRFAAADLNGDGLLNQTEFHAFAYPASHQRVLKVETMHHFEIFDKDGNHRISLEEFIKDSMHLEDFSHEAAREDFFLHDNNGSGDLDAVEFERLLAGHDLLLNSVNKAISAVDTNGDGHISISEEVPNGIQGLLDSEYIEDFFYHDDLGRHQEL